MCIDIHGPTSHSSRCPSSFNPFYLRSTLGCLLLRNAILGVDVQAFETLAALFRHWEGMTWNAGRPAVFIVGTRVADTLPILVIKICARRDLRRVWKQRRRCVIGQFGDLALNREWAETRRALAAGAAPSELAYNRQYLQYLLMVGYRTVVCVMKVVATSGGAACANFVGAALGWSAVGNAHWHEGPTFSRHGCFAVREGGGLECTCVLVGVRKRLARLSYVTSCGITKGS